MQLDTRKIDDAVLALMYLTLHDDCRAWKAFDWEATARLHEQGLIENPANRAKSIVLTERGLQESERLFKALFAKE